tara:strand:- start:5035 stop:5784 length:750 start_codon:yes stop_codon:yes gene_type:complete
MNKNQKAPTNVCRFEDSLVNYQEDLRRIIHKHRNKSSSLSVEDVVSTINFQLIKTKDKFFEKFGYEFSVTDFKKWAYAFARNNCEWDESRDFHKRKHLKDGTFYTEEGEKTLFDIVCDTEGEENEELEEFDAKGKLQVIEKLVNKYSHILSDNEKEIFEFLLRGYTEERLADRFQVSRQAINVTKQRIYAKLQSSYNLSVEDVAYIPLEEIRDHIEVMEGMFECIEKRRLRDPRVTSKSNRNPYKYAVD